MRLRTHCARALVAVTGAVVGLAALGLPGRAHAGDALPGPAKAEFERRKAAEVARGVWGPAQRERVQRWRQGGRFEEISAAAEDALTRFPEDEAVTMVVEVASVINSNNATLAEGPGADRLDAWCLDLALRALERLPRPASPEQHWRLVSRIHLARTPTSSAPDAAGSKTERRRILSAVLGFLRRWFDEADPLWDATTPLDHYPPRRASDPRWQMGLGARGPDDEQEFRRVEEAYFATLLQRDAQWALRRARDDIDLPSILATLGRLFPAGQETDAELRVASSQVPEFDLPMLLEIARGAGEQGKRYGSGVTLRLEEPKGGSWFVNRHREVGQSPNAVLAIWNGTDAPKVVPIGLARVAVVYGDGPMDERVLPPRRAPRGDDLVVVGPWQRAEFPLAIPMPRSGLARVVVSLANDATHVGDAEGVWTGTERLVELVDVSPAWVRHGTSLRALQDTAQRAGIPVPRGVEDVRRMVEALARAWRDDRAVEVLRALAVGSNDADVVRAAVESLLSALDDGYGQSAHFAFAAIAADPMRPQDVRLRALDGLARFARDRVVGGFTAGPQVRVVVDEATPPRLVADVQARLGILARDADVEVAERARAALGR